MEYSLLSITSSSTSLPEGSCGYCGTFPAHSYQACPMVRAVEYFPDGTIKRVERFSPSELQPPYVIQPPTPIYPVYPFNPQYPYGYPYIVTCENVC